MKTSTSADTPERLRTTWAPYIDKCLKDTEHRWIAESGVDFKPGDYEGIRKKVHGIARNHKVKAHTRQLPDGTLAFWFVPRPE